MRANSRLVDRARRDNLGPGSQAKHDHLMGDKTPGSEGMDAVMADAGEWDAPSGAPIAGTPGPVGLDSTSGAGDAPITYTGWPRSISWDEFTPRTSRPAGVQEDAEIKCASNPRWDWSCDGGNCRITALTVEARVNRDASWVVEGRQSAELLHHEQGHYDIFGVLTRELNQALVALRARSGAALQRQIASTRASFQARIDQLMVDYDNQTQHGADRTAQRRWDERLRSSIDNGTPFSPPPAP
jgi:hypothetical protein